MEPEKTEIKTVKLSELDMNALKALAYDMILKLEHTQIQLRAIQEEINKREKV